MTDPIPDDCIFTQPLRSGDVVPYEIDTKNLRPPSDAVFRLEFGEVGDTEALRLTGVEFDGNTIRFGAYGAFTEPPEQLLKLKLVIKGTDYRMVKHLGIQPER